MGFAISYAVPQYVKDGDSYRLILKGGIVFTASRETTAKYGSEGRLISLSQESQVKQF